MFDFLDIEKYSILSGTKMDPLAVAIYNIDSINAVMGELSESKPVNITQLIIDVNKLTSKHHAVLVGGLAVGKYGLQRATNDIDLVVATKDIAAFEKDAVSLGFTKHTETPFKGRTIVQFRDTQGREMDLITFDDKTINDDIAKDAHHSNILGVDVLVASIETIIFMKRLALRRKDQDDLLRLEPQHHDSSKVLGLLKRVGAEKNYYRVIENDEHDDSRAG